MPAFESLPDGETKYAFAVSTDVALLDEELVAALLEALELETIIFTSDTSSNIAVPPDATWTLTAFALGSFTGMVLLMNFELLVPVVPEPACVKVVPSSVT